MTRWLATGLGMFAAIASNPSTRGQQAPTASVAPVTTSLATTGPTSGSWHHWGGTPLIAVSPTLPGFAVAQAPVFAPQATQAQTFTIQAVPVQLAPSQPPPGAASAPPAATPLFTVQQAGVTVDQVEGHVRQMRQLSIQATQGLVDRLGAESAGLRARLAQVESELSRAKSLLRELEAPAPQAPPAPQGISLPPKPEASRASDESRQAVAESLRNLAGQAPAFGVSQANRREFLADLARQFYARAATTSPFDLNEAEVRDVENLIDQILQSSGSAPSEPPPAPATPQAGRGEVHPLLPAQ